MTEPKTIRDQPNVNFVIVANLLANIDHRLDYQRTLAEIDEILRNRFPSSYQEVVPFQEVRGRFSQASGLSAKIQDASFIINGTIYVPFRNNGKKCIGMLCLDEKNAKREGLTPELIRYVGTHGGQVLAYAKRAEELAARADTDDLTGLYLKRRFEEDLPSEIKRARDTGKPLSLVFFDLDQFKQYNDTYGHQQGDAALRAVGQVIRDNLHRDTDRGVRWGGDEMAALLPFTDVEGAEIVAERILRGLSNKSIDITPTTTDSTKLYRADLDARIITASIGVATFPIHTGDNGESAVRLINCADRATYLAKEQGRARVVVFDL